MSAFDAYPLGKPAFVTHVLDRAAHFRTNDDKLFAMEGFVGLWPTDNYDQNQAGFYIAAYEGLGDSSYNYIAQDTVSSMIGVLACNQAPERFASLVLVGPSPRYLDDPADGYVGGFSESDIAGLLDFLDRDYAAITGYNGSTYSGGLLGGTAPGAGFGSGLAAYHSNQSYTGGKVILVDRAGHEA